MQLKTLLVSAALLLSGLARAQEVDVCVYGGTSAGVIAAYTAKKLHKSVILISPDKHLGGLTTGGLGYTDIGNKSAITGISRDFYRRIGSHYGRFEQWIFEPHVAEATFHQYIKAADVPVIYQYQLAGVEMQGQRISAVKVTGADTRTIRAKMFIDCSYEGDLMARAGVSYTVGREANSQYNETYNGVQLREKHQFPDGIDPYRTPGKPESGLLWGISPAAMEPQGSGDKKVQTYNFRICLSNDPKNSIAITQPEDYQPARYELLLRLLEKLKSPTLNTILKVDRMPNNKTDINNNGAFSTDMIGRNYDYPEADAAGRKQIIHDHEVYTKGLLYFIGHDPRMPQHLRDEMLQWGYPKDEYTDNGHWSPQLYVREVRRMVGEYVMTQANCEAKEKVTDGVGMAAYTMDSHNCQRIVVNGMVKNEGDVQIGGFGPYPVSYRSIIPKKGQCENLLVPVCLSASHIAYGSIRMEPVFMVLAQSAATAAALAIDTKVSVQQADVAKIQQQLKNDPLADGSTPEILVDDNDATYTTKSGDWQTENRGGYGPTLLLDNGKGNTIRYSPAIKKAGAYQVYTYVPRVANHAAVTPVQVFDGRKQYNTAIKSAEVKVEGQTSGEWVDLGKYSLQPGAWVELSGKGASGVVVADAVLFVPVKGR
ncbi:FAD dependent oxidoreductase [Chitinophaga jiangningensis]|uniref:FAD dependent oxidoreductase n=1 Tax=Chitinophaga jiangningensis TaxID=1419482 RepID=A0A1M6XSP0_9BACT|nr:FAD-dependent oxidoreductase [Chitinophaga jiangningensis]SHL08825.1 FAD dependent oxidoreductase [Chitinophaga jiangningensis]